MSLFKALDMASVTVPTTKRRSAGDELFDADKEFDEDRGACRPESRALVCLLA